jgi:hypothetical protein
MAGRSGTPEMAWLALIVMYLSQRGAARFHAAPRFLGNKTVSGTKGRQHPQPGRSLSLACAAFERAQLRDYRRSTTLPCGADGRSR